MSETNTVLSFDTDYRIFLSELKLKVRNTQIKASLAANSILIEFYWELGKEIVRLQLKNKPSTLS